MIINSIKVSKSVCISTAPFESKRIEYELSATISENENHNSVYNNLSSIIESKLREEYNQVKQEQINTLPIQEQAFAELNDLPSVKIETPSQISCPKCGAPMVLKNGKTGQFWGCSTYRDTKCTGTVSLEQAEFYLNNGYIPKRRTERY